MIKNNVELDVKVKFIESRLTPAQMRRKLKLQVKYINKIIKKQNDVGNKTFVQILRTFG